MSETPAVASVDESDRVVLRGLVERVPLERQIAEVAERLGDLPEYAVFVEGAGGPGGPGDPERGLPAILLNTRTFLRWLVDGRPPDEADLERLRDLISVRAAEGRPQEEGVAVYRRGLQLGWRVLYDAADDGERLALAGAVDVLLSWLDVVARTFQEVYAQQRDALLSQHERRARSLIDRIVAGEPLVDADLRLAEILGFAPGETYRPFVASLRRGTVAQHADLAARLRGRYVLAATEGRRIVGLRTGTAAWPPHATDPRLLVATGEPRPVDGLADGLDDLRTVLRLAEDRGRLGVVEDADYLPELLLGRSPHLAARLVDRVFGTLEASGREDLVATLETLARNAFERGATAAALPVHRNTLTYRLGRIEALTGLDVDDPRERALIWLATLAPDAR